MEITVVDVLLRTETATGKGFEREFQGAGSVLFHCLDARYVGVLFMKTHKVLQYTYVYISVCTLYFNNKLKNKNRETSNLIFLACHIGF